MDYSWVTGFGPLISRPVIHYQKGGTSPKKLLGGIVIVAKAFSLVFVVVIVYSHRLGSYSGALLFSYYTTHQEFAYVNTLVL